MVIMGIDPGLAVTGWLVLGDKMLAQGTVRTRSDIPTLARVRAIYEELQTVADRYAVDEIVIENFKYYGKNVTSTAKMNRLIGAIYLIGNKRNFCKITEYYADEWMKGIVGKAYKLKSKAVIRFVVEKRLGEKVDTYHTADACGVALYHRDIKRLGDKCQP
ncbi:MAG: crossover junction endodeoxyribonuclease RuvC [Thermodesulfobacteriota bacterium]